MFSLKIKQVKSGNGRTKDQRDTLRGLGLGRIGRTRTLKDTPEARGMIRKVIHLLKVEEVN